MAEPSDNKQKRRTAGAGKQGREDLSSYVFGKVPPQAVPLEEAILGAILLEKDALTQVLDVLQHDAFYVDAHQLIYSAFLRLFERSQPIDLLTVMEELKKGGELEAIGLGRLDEVLAMQRFVSLKMSVYQMHLFNLWPELPADLGTDLASMPKVCSIHQ